jgi:hypothetical protein
MRFSLNGKDMGEAFTAVGLGAGGDEGSSGGSGFFPAISVEGEESMRINIGQRPFRFEPPPAKATAKGKGTPKGKGKGKGKAEPATAIKPVLANMTGTMQAAIASSGQAPTAATTAADAAGGAGGEGGATAAAAPAESSHASSAGGGKTKGQAAAKAEAEAKATPPPAPAQPVELVLTKFSSEAQLEALGELAS